MSFCWNQKEYPSGRRVQSAVHLSIHACSNDSNVLLIPLLNRSRALGSHLWVSDFGHCPGVFKQATFRAFPKAILQTRHPNTWKPVTSVFQAPLKVCDSRSVFFFAWHVRPPRFRRSSVPERQKRARTPLHLAAQWNHTDVLEARRVQSAERTRNYLAVYFNRETPWHWLGRRVDGSICRTVRQPHEVLAAQLPRVPIFAGSRPLLEALEALVTC